MELSDFNISTGVTSLTAGDEQINFTGRLQKDFVVLDSNDSIGKVVMTVPLDVKMDPDAAYMATLFEYFSISEIILDFQSTSPLGTSSGGIQLCCVTDPENATFDQSPAGSAFNVQKAIRTEGSCLIRPRVDQRFTSDTKGQLYTYATGNPRLESFGTIVLVVRDAPAAGDAVQWAVTVQIKYNFIRMTSQSTSTSAVADVPLTITPSPATKTLEFSVPENLNGLAYNLFAKSPLKIAIIYLIGNIMHTAVIHLQSMDVDHMQYQSRSFLRAKLPDFYFNDKAVIVKRLAILSKSAIYSVKYLILPAANSGATE